MTVALESLREQGLADQPVRRLAISVLKSKFCVTVSVAITFTSPR